jgi:hypothetical protein
MRHLYLPLAHEAFVYDNRDRASRLIARRTAGSALIVLDKEIWARIEELTPLNTKTIGEMTSEEIFEAVDGGMSEVVRRLESGELDQSGRYFTDEELAAGAATGSDRAQAKPKTESAA